MEIHVNIAKQTLWEFWQRYKEEKDFECTFLLMGVLQDNGMRVEVVREKDLSTAKEKYSKVLSEHIYSLQKVLPELQLLGLAEKGDIRYAAIKCLENNERSDEEIHALRWGAMSNKTKSVPQEETVQPIPESNKAKKVSSPEEKHIDGKKNNADRKGFNNLFGKATGKQTSTVQSSTEKMETDSSNKAKQTINDTPASSKKPGQKGGLNSFFHLGRNQSADKKAEDKKSEDKMSADKESADSPERKKNTSPVEISKIEKKVIAKNISKQKNARGKKRNRSKESNDTAKRRKRITIHSDSSSAGSSDEEEEIPPSPEKVSPVRLPRSPSPPRVQLRNGKCKVLKKVDKTFEEDGFLVTKKVHVYESCSEEEPEVAEVKKPVALEPQPEAKGKKSTKQTTLMNFFKKS